MLKLKLKNVSFFFLFTKGMTRPNQKIFSKNKKKNKWVCGLRKKERRNHRPREILHTGKMVEYWWGIRDLTV